MLCGSDSHVKSQRQQFPLNTRGTPHSNSPLSSVGSVIEPHRRLVDCRVYDVGTASARKDGNRSDARRRLSPVVPGRERSPIRTSMAEASPRTFSQLRRWRDRTSPEVSQHGHPQRKQALILTDRNDWIQHTKGIWMTDSPTACYFEVRV